MTPRPHWLTRPETIRRLWIVFGAILALVVLVESGVAVHGHFGLDATFGFNAWYGFVTCVAMVLIAKALGSVLKRDDRYYDE